MISKFKDYKEGAIKLRKKGLVYSEIQKKLKINIPKSTLSTWFKGLKISKEAQLRINNTCSLKLKKAHEAALKTKKIKRKKYFNDLKKKVSHLLKYLNNIDIAKIALAVLYLGEGAKTRKGSLMLGNSDPKIIKLFLDLLRKCYKIDESKFRCTLQCRSDQDISKLEKFWSEITGISLEQFYKARIDPRSVGNKTKKIDYKGVCRIDYFSADVYNEIKKIIEVICV